MLWNHLTDNVIAVTIGKKAFPKIIGITGKKYNGKDTIGDFLVKNHNYTKLSFAAPLKSACKEIFAFDDQQLYGDLKEEVDPRWGFSPRQALQFVGTELFRKQMKNLDSSIDEKFWVKCMEMKLKKIFASSQKSRIVITDVRFQNEIELIKSFCDTEIWKVENANIISNDTHESEKMIDDLVGLDEIIYNNSTIKDLYRKVDALIKN